MLVIEPRQVTEAGGDVGVFGAEHVFVDGEGAAVERFDVAVAALLMMEQCQGGEGLRGFRVFGAEHLLTNGGRGGGEIRERWLVSALCRGEEVARF